MPVKLDLPADAKYISIDEYAGIIKDNKYDLSCHEDLVDSAVYFQQLNNNKTLVLDCLCQELKDFQLFQKRNFYGPQAFILYRSEQFFLRAVIWNPVSHAESLIKDFKYDICHDHNFDFLTAGYFGPGYSTRCYTYNFAEVKGLLGERVMMTPEGTLTLGEGDIMFYRSKTDIHIQLPPASISVTLNLMVKNKKPHIPQYQFDEGTGTICRYLHSSNDEFVVRLAGIVGDGNVVEPLLSIFDKTENMHIKAFAARSITQAKPELTDLIHSRVQSSGNSLLSDLYDRECRRYGSSYEVVSECR